MASTTPMPGKNRKRSAREFSPFTECPCCDGSMPQGRAAEKRAWQAEADDHLVRGEN